MKNLRLTIYTVLSYWLLAIGYRAEGATIISGTLSITNAAALTNATSGQSYTLNGNTRTFTNSLASPATQIRVLTNDTASSILLSLVAQAGSYPFADVTGMTTSNGTNVTFRATNSATLTITLSPTTWGKVTYSTQTVGTATVLAGLPLTAAQASQLWTNLDLSTNRGMQRLELDAGFGLHGYGLKATNYTLTTNDIYIGVTTASNTNLILTLPSASSASNQLFVLKDEGGAGGTNAFKIYPQTGDRIDGLTNLVVSNNFGGVMLRSRGGTNYAVLAAGGGVSGGSGGGGGGSGSVALTNSVWVAKNGSDAIGERGDPSKAFLTLGAAKTAATSGDTIFVMPGTYDEKNLLKNGVNWHFFLGAKVIYTGSGDGSIFDDGSDGANTAVTSTITGYGEFANNGSAQFYVLMVENNSTIRLQGLSATADDYVVNINTGGDTPTVELNDFTINGTSRNPVFINDSLATATFNRCKLVMTDTDNNGAALYFFSANTNCTLRDCVLTGNSGASSPVAIKAFNAGTQIRIEGTLTANLGMDANAAFYADTSTRLPGDLLLSGALSLSGESDQLTMAGGELLLNGSPVGSGGGGTNFNLLDSTTIIWDLTSVTNISAYATNLTDAEIASGAAIARDKLAAGTANYVLINDGSGDMSSEARLAMSRGGTGVSLSDPGADAALVWDDSAGSNRFATLGTGLAYLSGSLYPTNLGNAQIASGAAIAKSKISTSSTWADADIPSNVSRTTNSETLQNKTITATAAGGNNTVKLKGYILLSAPSSCDGTGAFFETNTIAAYFGQAFFNPTNAATDNWVEYRLTVPEDIDTSVDLKVERFRFRLGGADTNAHSYVISQAAVATSGSYDSPTLGQSVTLSFVGDVSGADGDVENISSTTLTNWAANVTAGRLWVLRLARNGDTDASTVGSYSGPLVISYGISQ